MLVADFVEDTNGNLLTISNPQQTAQQGGAFTVSDTLGRTLLSSSGLGTTGNTISVAGLPNPYTFTWTTAAVNFSTTWTNTKRNAAYGCRAPNTSFSTSYSEVQVITLPNGKQYTFTYDPTYGTLSQITYPIGGWIRYTWGLNLQSENAYTLNGKGQLDGTCAYRFDIPALATRQVSFDGQTIALQQDFTYVTNWNATDPTKWDTKQTTVTTHDLITGQVYQTVYSYSSFGITYYGFNQIALRNLVPLEASTAYKDTAGATLKTVNKTWYDQYMLKSESTTLDNGLTSQVTYTYSSAGAQITEKDEYDFGQTTPTRKTIHNYQSFANSPTLSAGASVFDRPCQMIVYDSSGNRVAETDYYYDGSTGATPCSTAATQSLPGTGNYTSHDETLYGPASTAPRGNLTTVVKQCFQAAQTCPSGNPSSSYSYDETGQLLTATDALGHSTTYSYADRFTDTTPPGVTNAYLTTITRPATNGVAHVQNFSYAYSDGQLTISADENSLQTTYAYNDSLRRLTETDSPNGGQILISRKRQIQTVCTVCE